MKLSGPYRMPRRASPGRRRRLTLLGALAASNPSIAALVQQIASQFGLNPGLALAVATQESGLNPNATSRAGAQGVMQLEPATAQQYGVTNPFDPVQNITAGVKYLLSLLSEFGGDLGKALAAYNWGPENVTKAVDQYGASWLYYAPAETQNYVETLAGVVPVPPPGGSAAPPAAAPQIITLDPATGQPVETADDTSAAAAPAPAPSVDPTVALLIAGGMVAAYFLLEAVL